MCPHEVRTTDFRRMKTIHRYFLFLYSPPPTTGRMDCNSCYEGTLRGLRRGWVEPMDCQRSGTKNIILKLKECLSMKTIDGIIFRENNDLVARIDDHAFYTTYNPLLYEILSNTIQGYKVNPGTRPEEKAANNPSLILRVKNGYGPTKDIAFAEIVYQFFSGLDSLREIAETGDWTKTSRKIVQNHFFLSSYNQVCDHLTENRANNYPWAVGMIPQSLNKTIGSRASIGYPYYFLTMRDVHTGIYKIKLGVNNGQVCWERRYQLENLGELGWQCGDGPIYTTIFRAFQRRIGKKNSSTTGETCLRKWGNPVYAHDPDNPFVIAGMESLSIYPRAVDQFPVDVQDGVPWPDLPIC